MGFGVPYWLLLAYLGVFGIVNSLQFSAMNTLSLRDLDSAHASSGNGLLSVVMQLSMSLGVAAAGALLAGFGGHTQSHGSEAVVRTFQYTYVCVGLLSAMAAFIFSQLARSEEPKPRPPQSVNDG
jgi:hypothetical protein